MLKPIINKKVRIQKWRKTAKIFRLVYIACNLNKYKIISISDTLISVCSYNHKNKVHKVDFHENRKKKNVKTLSNYLYFPCSIKIPYTTTIHQKTNTITKLFKYKNIKTSHTIDLHYHISSPSVMCKNI